MVMTTNLARPAVSARAPMLPGDALFWHAEEAIPQVRLQVGGLLILDRAPDRNLLRASVQRWTASVPRLRQRVVESPLWLGLPEWENDPHFDLDFHLRELVLPQPGSQRRLLDFAGSAVVTPLDHLRPPWEAYSIGGLEGGRAACLFKLHHSIVDGVGSMALFEMLTQAGPADAVCVPRLRARRRELARALRRPSVTEMARSAAAAAFHPLRTAQQFLRTMGAFGGMIRDFNAHAIRDPLADPDSDIGRRFDTLLLSLPRMQSIKNALGVTLNDLVLTAVAGAVGRYHEQHGVPVKELECMVPKNLRQAHDEVVGNRVGVFIVPLPVGEHDPLRRLRKIRSLTTAAKGTSHGSSSEFLLQALAFVPGVAFRVFSQTMSGKIGLICTNLPGPRAQRYLAGAKVEAMYPFLPAMFGIPLTVALLSYGDTYAVGIDTDGAAIKHPGLLCRYIEDGVEEIARRALHKSSPGLFPHHRPSVSRIPRREHERACHH